MNNNGVLIGLGVGAAVAAAIYFIMRSQNKPVAPAANPESSYTSGGSSGQFVPGYYTGTNSKGQTIEPIAIKSPFQATQPVLHKAVESQTSPFITVRTKTVVAEPAPVPTASPSPIVQQASSATTGTTTSPFANTKQAVAGLFGTHI